jgi:lipoprotein-releasing system permease protein
LNLSAFIAKRIAFKSKRTFSKLSVRIAILGIMLGLAVMILTMAIIRGFKAEIREKVRGFSGDIIVVKYDLNYSFENSPFVINKKTLNQFRTDSEIAFYQPYASKAGIIKTADEVEGVVLKGVDKTYRWDFFKKILIQGRVPDFSDSNKVQREIMISKHTADRLKKNVGDEFLMYFVQQPLRKRKFEIVGIYNLGVEDVDKMYVIGDLRLVRKLNNWSAGEVGGYEIRLKNFDNLDSTAEKIYNSIDMNLKSYSVKEYYPAIFQWLSLLDVNTQVILVLMMAVAVINMVSALLIIILERTNMIGILKALGSTNWAIQKIFLNNAAFLIGIGLLLGNVLGLGICFFQQNTHLLKLDQASYYMDYVPVELHLVDVVLLNAGTLIICLLVLLIPSFVVTKIAPVKAIAFK